MSCCEGKGAYRAPAAGTVGKEIRMARIFPHAGGSLVVAADHGIFGVFEGLEDVPETVRQLLPAGPDAFLFNTGMFRRVYRQWAALGRQAPGVILGLDTHIRTTIPRSPQSGDAYRLLASVEQAAAMGADAVKVVLVFAQDGLEPFALNLETVAQVIREGDRLGMPVMVEPTFWGRLVGEGTPVEPAGVAHICRIAVELGADIIKAPFVGSPDEYRPIVEHAPVPVTILGGARSNRLEEMLNGVRAAMQIGVRGVVFGRNVWQYPDKTEVIRELRTALQG